MYDRFLCEGGIDGESQPSRFLNPGVNFSSQNRLQNVLYFSTKTKIKFRLRSPNPERNTGVHLTLISYLKKCSLKQIYELFPCHLTHTEMQNRG